MLMMSRFCSVHMHIISFYSLHVNWLVLPFSHALTRQIFVMLDKIGENNKFEDIE
jgi:hypothetical protein